MKHKQLKQTNNCDCGKKPMALKTNHGRRIVCLNNGCKADNKRASMPYAENFPKAIRQWNAIHT